MTEKIQQPSS